MGFGGQMEGERERESSAELDGSNVYGECRTHTKVCNLVGLYMCFPHGGR